MVIDSDGLMCLGLGVDYGIKRMVGFGLGGCM